MLVAAALAVSQEARAQTPSNDATLSGLTLSGINFGTFASDTELYAWSFRTARLGR